MKSGVPAGIVAALGLTQIIGYGTLYYSFSILAPAMARDLGLTVEQVFGVFSASLLVGGLSAPLVGGWMDRFGAATIMTFGSAVSALALLLCAWSPSTAVFAIAIVLLEVASSMVQYQAAFAALVEIRPKAASRSITYLTLIGGFASTIFWPIAASLGEFLSWREIYIAYALLNLLVCLPLHRWIMRSRTPAAIRSSGLNREAIAGALPVQARRRGMLLVSLAFALQGFTLSAILTHMVPMLGAIGFGAAAVMIGSLFGPSQVLSRLINMTFGANLLPPCSRPCRPRSSWRVSSSSVFPEPGCQAPWSSRSVWVSAPASTALRRDRFRSGCSDRSAMVRLREEWPPHGWRQARWHPLSSPS